jgi:predicted nuclease of predicted toxin-antitoxin system
MKILADHCVFGKTVKLLREHGYEVITLKELGKADTEDEEVLSIASSLNAILITNDKDFGNILRYPPERYGGIIVLKITFENQGSIHEILLNMLKKYDQEQLKKALVVINTKTYRMRR